MIVAITQRVMVNEVRRDRSDAIDQRLAAWVAAAGGIPVPLPNVLGDEQWSVWLDRVAPAAFVLSGGEDRGYAPERDRTEDRLLTHARAMRMPVLGICRGLQMMTLAAGGTLVEQDGHIATRHSLRHAPGQSPLRLEVNSFHRWAIGECPGDFEVMAWAPDGSIEAMRHRALPWEGWMWHPEREAVPGADVDRARALLLPR